MANATMNSKQQAAYNRVIDSVLYGNYEVKDVEISDNEYNKDVYVQLETGIADEESKVSWFLLRSCYCFFIGEKGGIYVFNSNYNRQYVKPYELITMDIYRR